MLCPSHVWAALGLSGQWQENVDMGSVSEESTMPPSSLP